MRWKTVGIRGDARRNLLEHNVDGGQDVLAGTERVLEFTRLEIELGAPMCGIEIAPHFLEFFWRGILERIDRLLFVADREDRARARVGARAGGELGD